MLSRKPVWRYAEDSELHVEEGGELKRVEDEADVRQLIHGETLFDSEGTPVGTVGMTVGREILVVPVKDQK